MLFDFLKDILYKKTGSVLNSETESEFQPFLLQRWISFYSPQHAVFLNKTLNNGLYKVFDTKQEWYKIFLTSLPRTMFKKIKYVKKIKNKKEEDLDILYTFLAKEHELSKREVEKYILEHKIDIEGLKGAINERTKSSRR